MLGLSKSKNRGRYILVDKGEIQAVHDDDLKILLKSLGVFEQVQNGTEKCFYCGKTISMENLQCIFPYNNEVNFCCTEDICYRNLVSRGLIEDGDSGGN
jgi:hypothetical protein